MTTVARPWVSSYPESLVHRPSDDPSDLLTAFRATVGRHAARPAVHYFGSTTTWEEVDRQSDALAVYLAEVGVGHGDRVAVYLQNVPAYLVTLLAAWNGEPSSSRSTR
jgi:long-chain acyl-CoA synthetase